MMKMRRNNKRIWLGILGVFVTVSVFSFLIQRKTEDTDAANFSNFKAGYIISDFQMTDYNSMNESQIQSFLKSKNSCNDTRTYLTGNNLGYVREDSPYSWHVSNGHYVCLADERFAAGTAAHIIYRAAQDYRINPKVLIVLLQKEQGLITDTLPNSVQYRSATGYGCPDTAACSSKYYGFNNQVRNAAALFRTVMDGGWTNYPVGNNYIQYNPNKACGGSIVNIQNRATSALYRYTPYQPNAGALAAGYGTASCGAYGNRNFFSYFEDWFGNINSEGQWETMKSPRIMKVRQDTLKVNPRSMGLYDDWARVGYKYYFTSKINVFWKDRIETCLRTEEDTRNNVNRCIIMSRMDETNEKLYNVVESKTEQLMVYKNTNKYEFKSNRILQELKVKDYYSISFSEKIVYNGVTYYRTTHDKNNNIELFVPAESLRGISFVNFKIPRNMMVTQNKFIDLKTGQSCKAVRSGFVGKFTTKIDRMGESFYRLEEDGAGTCVISSQYVTETDMIPSVPIGGDFVDFKYPRNLIQAKGGYQVDLKTGKVCDYVEKGMIKKYTTKVNVGNKAYYRDENATKNGSYCAVRSDLLGET